MYIVVQRPVPCIAGRKKASSAQLLQHCCLSAVQKKLRARGKQCDATSSNNHEKIRASHHMMYDFCTASGVSNGCSRGPPPFSRLLIVGYAAYATPASRSGITIADLCAH